MTKLFRIAPVSLLTSDRLLSVCAQTEGLILDLGSGGRRLYSGVISVDINSRPFVDIRADGHSLPFRNETFDFVVCTSVLEHVPHPKQFVAEALRVTKPGGHLWFEVPFLYHFHTAGDADPHDYWRWTANGARRLFAGVQIVETGLYIGPGTALRLIMAETFALLFHMRNHTGIYYLARNILSWLFYPLSWLDRFMLKSPFAHRVAGGFYLLARKPADCNG